MAGLDSFLALLEQEVLGPKVKATAAPGYLSFTQACKAGYFSPVPPLPSKRFTVGSGGGRGGGRGFPQLAL